MKAATMFLLLPLVIPLVTPLASLFNKRFGRFISLPFYLTGLGIGIYLVAQVFSESILLNIGGWSSLFAINLVLGPLSLTGGMFLYGIAFFTSLADIQNRRPAYYTMLYNLFLFALVGMLMTADLFNLFVLAEIASIASIALIAAGSKERGPGGSIRYLVVGALTSLLMLAGIGMLYSAVGTFNIAALSQVTELSRLFGLLCGIAILGLVLFHSELIPFNTWVPGAYSGASPAFAASLAGMGGLTGILVLSRLVFVLFGANSAFAYSSKALTFIVFVIGIVSMLAGEIAALRTKNIFRMLGFSSIGQMGMIAIAIGYGSKSILWPAVLLIAAHTFAKVVMLLIAGFFSRVSGTGRWDKMKGIGRQYPLISAIFIITSLSLMGVPLFMGFWGKLGVIIELLKTAIRDGSRFWIVPSLIAVITIVTASVIEGIYLMRVGHSFFEKDDENAALFTKQKGLLLHRIALLVPAIMAAVVIVAIGIYPNFTSYVVSHVVDDIYLVQNYITTILP